MLENLKQMAGGPQLKLKPIETGANEEGEFSKTNN